MKKKYKAFIDREEIAISIPGKLDNLQKSIPVIEKHSAMVKAQYIDATRSIQMANGRRKRIFGGGQNEVARNQIAIAMNQYKMQAEAEHNRFQEQLIALKTKFDSAAQDISNAKKNCDEFRKFISDHHDLPDDSRIEIELTNINAYWDRLVNISKMAQSINDDNEKVWNFEHEQQENMLGEISMN